MIRELIINVLLLKKYNGVRVVLVKTNSHVYFNKLKTIKSFYFVSRN
jgi:hypothetical protein